MTDLKRNEVLSFDDGLLTVKMEGHGRANGWGVLAFHERQIEVDADGYHSVEIPPTELRELHAFLGRVLALSAAPGEPCAWAEIGSNGNVLTCRPDKSVHCTTPLYTTPQPAAGWDEAIERVQSAYEELCVRFSGAHSDRAMDSVLLRLYVALKSLRREAPAPAVDLTNHHNALKCPYCNPEGLTFARPDTAEARLREALERAREAVNAIVLSTHSVSFKADLDAIDKALSTGDEATKSEGGVEGHATARPSTSSAVIWPGDDRGTAREAPMTSCRGDEAERSRKDGAGIKPSPSEPSPPDDRREIVARIKGWIEFLDTNAAQSRPLASIELSNGGSLADDLRAILAVLDGGRDA